MRTLFIISLLLMVSLSFIYSQTQPDLSKKEELKALGTGRIIESDNSIITNITLYEVKEYWIVYLKDESLHDFMMDKIDRIEFRESKWGPIKIKFPTNKPTISGL